MEKWRLKENNVNIKERNKNIKENGENRNDRYENYKGKVYCCTVEGDGIIYVRRNGYPVWCGNSRHKFCV